MLVSFEGIEGSGKSTQIALLAKWLGEMGKRALATREPGGSWLGKDLRRLLLDKRAKAPCPLAELHLFLADRAQHLSETVMPALERGMIVLCDRYVDSTIAYQAYGRGLDPEYVTRLGGLGGMAPLPARTILLDLPVETGLARALARNEPDDSSEGRFDGERLEFHGRVRDGYLNLAKACPDRFRIIDASGNARQVFEACKNVLAVDIFEHMADSDA